MPSQPSIPADRAVAILRAVAAGASGPTLYAISGSRPSLVRDLQALRRDLGVAVDWVPTERRYAIRDWGALRRSRIVR